MKATFAAVIAVAIFASGCALADSIFPECQSLSPADAAVLSVAQLKIRYCEAKAKKDQGFVEWKAAQDAAFKAFENTMPGNGGTRQQKEQADRHVEIINAKYAACGPAMGTIAKLIAEKGTKIETDGKLIDDKMCN